MNNVSKPLISLVVPTRERCETLKFTLQTAVNQANRDYEIIVSDNFSQDETKKVVEQFGDQRIKYVNTGKRLSMCDNWDFALEHVTGNYALFIGDDDGVMPGAIDKLAKFISEYSSPIYLWKIHTYTWPTAAKGPVINYLAPKVPPTSVNLRKRAQFSIAWGGWKYYRLPQLYHSAVSRVVLEHIKQRTGRVFHSTNPDVFLGFALPALADQAINVGESLTVHGKSAKSNGGAWTGKECSEVHRRFIQEYGDYQMHRALYPGAPFQVNAFADAILIAMELFPEYYGAMKFNYNAMWAFWHSSMKFDSSFGVIKQRKHLNKYHPFDVARFMFYRAVNATYSIYLAGITARRKISGKHSQNRPGTIPSNIFDLVNSLGSKQD